MKINARNAAWLALGIQGFAITFHLLVVFNIIPGNLVWGGKIRNRKELLRMEMFSLLFNFVIIIVSLSYLQIIPRFLPFKFMRIVFALLAILFIANTAGNLLAESDVERFIMTPLTLLGAIAFFLMARQHDYP